MDTAHLFCFALESLYTAKAGLELTSLGLQAGTTILAHFLSYTPEECIQSEDALSCCFTALPQCVSHDVMSLLIVDTSVSI